MASLFLNSTYSALLGYAAFFFLTIKSGVYLLGIYNTVLAMMSFFTYMTNMGLAAALIQKKDIEEKDLHTAFIMQMALSVVAVTLGFFLTDKIFIFYTDLPYSARYLYWSVLVSFILLSLKTIPSVMLEKKVQIYKVVTIQAIENTVFYVTIIAFLFLGYDIESIVIAVLARSIVGMIGVYIMYPWFPKLQFSGSSAVRLLRYGIPFQSNSFLALIKDDLLIMYLGGAIGLTNLGYVSFAKKYAEFLLRLVMDNANRVFFPIYSFIQNEKDKLVNTINKQLFFQSLLLFPTIIGLVFVFDRFLSLFPEYYIKWKPSLFSFYFFSLSSLFVSLSSTFTNIFNALGKLKISVGLMIFWTISSWILNVIGIKLFGYNGVSIAFFILSCSFVITAIVAYKVLNVSLWLAIKIPAVAVVIMSICLLFFSFAISFIHERFIGLLILIAVGFASYSAVIVVLQGQKIITEVQSLFTIAKTHE